MPRAAIASAVTRRSPRVSPYFNNGNSTKVSKPVESDTQTILNASVHFPTTAEERKQFANPTTGRRVTEFQFRVYDACAQIPKGCYSTYKHISDVLHASPRAVGQALRCNPFAPSPVPCHRVLSSTTFIGGFFGQWGSGGHVDRKYSLLEQEGLVFNQKHCLDDEHRVAALFTDFKA